MKSTTALHCIAPDGDYITEGKDFPDTESAWARSENMGSRWIFYPIHVVTGAGPAAVIRDVPEGMPKEWIGKRFAALLLAIGSDSQHAADYCNGETLFMIFP